MASGRDDSRPDASPAVRASRPWVTAERTKMRIETGMVVVAAMVVSAVAAGVATPVALRFAFTGRDIDEVIPGTQAIRITLPPKEMVEAHIT